MIALTTKCFATTINRRNIFYLTMPLKQNLPNILTVFRILAGIISLIVFEINLKFWNEIAFGLFFFGAVSDFFDGYLARKYKTDSSFGICFDPIADKIFVLAFFIIMIQTGVCNSIIAFIILGREFFVSGLREFLGKDGTKIPVSKLAKWKTGTQIVAIGIAIFYTSDLFKYLFDMWWLSSALFKILPFLGDIAIYLAALLTILTAANYVKVFIRPKKI